MSIFVPPRPTVYQPAQKASPQGPASGILQTQYPLASLLNQQSAQRKMQRAWQLGVEVPWIAAAERVIAGQFTGVPWHLEDDNEETLDDKSGGDGADAYALMSKPQAKLDVGKKLTRSDLWRLTCRHMGLCGNAFWLLDAMNTFGLPNAIIYIRPDRMTPVETEQGNLLGWLIDKTSTDPGIPVTLNEIVQFMFQPPDTGHFGIGLVESALLKASISVGLDRHLATVIDAGGRLSGIMSPKAGQIEPDTMVQMERDWRAVVEQSDPAKRLQIVRGPVDFTPTTMTLQEQGLRDFMVGARDDLLSLWGVPTSALGLHDRGSGLGDSAVTLSDDAILWTNGVHPRLGNQDQGGFVETVQVQILDRWAALGSVIELCIDSPEFDDDAPKYENAQKAVSIPLRNVERRAILGLDPFGEDVRNPETGILVDDEVWMPMTMTQSFVAPSDGTKIPLPPEPVVVEPQNDAATLAAGETSDAKPLVNAKAKVNPRLTPLHNALVRIRDTISAKVTPRLKSSVRDVLDAQKRDIISRLREHSDEITRKPSDTQRWFARGVWDKKLTAALSPHLELMAQSVSSEVGDFLPRKADPFSNPVDRVLKHGAAKVTGINETTRAKIQDALIRGIALGYTANDVADLIEGIGAPEVGTAIGLDPASLFDDYRSEMIARTELMDAYNGAAIGSYVDAGIREVQAIDGDQDEECAARNGQTFSVDEAFDIEDHPNGTLDWLPVIDYGELREAFKAQPITVQVDNHIPVPMRVILERDEFGKVSGYHQERYGD